MARIHEVFPFALAAARQGDSATQFYNTMREAGMAARKSDMYRIFGIAKEAAGKLLDEPFANQQSVPHENELAPWVVKNGTGVSQRVLLTYKDSATGTYVSTWYSVKSENGISRESATAQAIDAYATKADAYDQVLIGAVHMAAYRLKPFQAT